MRDEDKRDAETTLQQLQLDLHLLAQLAIEGTQRFVEQQHTGAIHEGAGHRDALLLSTRHLARFTVGQFAHLHHVEGLGHSAGDFGLGHTLLAQTVCHVLTHGHVREECVMLEDRVHVALVGRYTLHVLTADTDVAGVGLFESGQHAQGRGLAAATRAEQRQELAGLNRQADRVDGHHGAEALGDVL